MVPVLIQKITLQLANVQCTFLGTSADLRMVRAYIELGLCSANLKFLMSKRNQVTTFDDFETMTKNLVDEVLLHLSQCSVQPSRIRYAMLIAHDSTYGNYITKPNEFQFCGPFIR